MAEPYFKAVQEAFVEHERRHYQRDAMLKVRLECHPWKELSEQEGFTDAQLRGHERGRAAHDFLPGAGRAARGHGGSDPGARVRHVYDGLYPAQWMLADGELLRFEDVEVDPENKAEQKARLARARQWRDRDADEVENVADAIATEVLGRQIRYCGPCVLQCFDRGMGARRPKGLR